MTDIRPSSRCACGKWWSNLESFQNHVCGTSVHAKCGRCSHQIGQHRLAYGTSTPTHRRCSIDQCECREFVDSYGDPVGSPDYPAQARARALEELSAQDPGITDKVGFVNTRSEVDDKTESRIPYVVSTVLVNNNCPDIAGYLISALHANGIELVDTHEPAASSGAPADSQPDYGAQILRDPGLFDPVEQDARRRRGLISRAVNLAADLRAEGRYTQSSVASRCAEEIRELAEAQSRWINDIEPAVKSDHFGEYLRAVAEWLIAEERHKGELAAAYWRDDILPAVRAESASRVSRVAHMRRGMRLDAALATIQQVRDAVKGARSVVQADPHGTFRFFLDRLDRITSEGA